MTDRRTVLRADCRRQYTYSDRCRGCARRIGEAHDTDCPHLLPRKPPE